ncbi:hypothetical protein STEG23_019164, partial [Scotinomys teguina]
AHARVSGHLVHAGSAAGSFVAQHVVELWVVRPGSAGTKRSELNTLPSLWKQASDNYPKLNPNNHTLNKRYSQRLNWDHIKKEKDFGGRSAPLPAYIPDDNGRSGSSRIFDTPRNGLLFLRFLTTMGPLCFDEFEEKHT